MKVAMFPDPISAGMQSPSGINTVILKYAEHAHEADIEFISDVDAADVVAVHVAKNDVTIPYGMPLVSHCHGLYWTADYPVSDWEYKANSDVIHTLLEADLVTVPSAWVAESIQRDMRIDPIVLPHGVDVDEWANAGSEWVLWNKNRAGDVCDPSWVRALAEYRHDLLFTSTFYSTQQAPPNVTVTGVVPHDDMKELITGCSVYLSTTKETFGVGILEAMASGKPILGFDEGGIRSLVQHGVNGYLATPGDVSDLQAGLDYCIKHAKVLGNNSREMAGNWSWKNAVTVLRSVYDKAVSPEFFNRNGLVSVVVPCYNKADTIEQTINSILNQRHLPTEIIIVDNNSTDNSREIAQGFVDDDTPVPIRSIVCDEQGVAHARNAGVREASGEYICCLDADDMIDEGFIETCLPPLLEDRTLGLTYTGLKVLYADGSSIDSPWPPEYEYSQFVSGVNQVPTCCIYRKEAWKRLAGYRQRYAPDGAGAEDVEFWYRMGAIGFRGFRVTDEHMFWYRDGGIVGGNKNYEEPDWRRWHSWSHPTGYHPFASMATPENGKSHPVRQYDNPLISVIVPIGPDHVEHVWEAVESVVGQTFARWELVLVNDSGQDLSAELTVAFPFVREIQTGGSIGAGAARNKGVDNSRAKLLLFLDADDWLEPDALERLWAGWVESGYAVYSDYYGYAVIDAAEAQQLKANGRLLFHDGKTGRTIIKYFAMDYDCEAAVRQPDLSGSIYIWCLVSTLVPREWHVEIGGFDERMQSWEDWDYWIRMAKVGRCFHRVKEHLINYRFFSGTRRMDGIRDHQKLARYMLKKAEGVDSMACGGCRGGRGTRGAATLNGRAQALRDVWGASRTDRALRSANGGDMDASSMVMVELVDNNSGDHPVIGNSSRVHYGYHVSGDRFLMDVRDARARPDRYRIREDISPVDPVLEERLPVPGTSSPPVVEPTHTLSVPDAPMPLSETADEQVTEETAPAEDMASWYFDKDGALPVYRLYADGVISSDQLCALEDAGYKDSARLLTAEVDDLIEVRGIGKVTATKIVRWMEE